jgi:hypothetical protein
VILSESGQHAYVTFHQPTDSFPPSWGGFHVVDVSDATKPELLGTYAAGRGVTRMTVSGSNAYVPFYDGMAVVDVSSPANPITRGECKLSLPVSALAVQGTYVYAAASNRVEIVDVADRASPKVIGTNSIEGRAFDITVSGGYAYVTEGNRENLGGVLTMKPGLHILDISDPAHPVRVGYYETTFIPKRVFVSGNYAYLTSAGVDYWRPDYNEFPELHVIDVRNPETPVRVDSGDRPTAHPSSLAISGDRLLMTDFRNLQVYNLIKAPRITGWRLIESGRLELSFASDSSTGALSIVESSPSLNLPVEWTAEPNVAISSSQIGTFEAALIPRDGARFFRIHSPQ